MDEITPEQLRNAASKKSKKGDRAVPSPETIGESNNALAQLAQQGDVTFAQLGKNLAQRHASILMTSYLDNMPIELSIAAPTVAGLFDGFDLPSIEYQQIAALMGGV